MPPHRAYWLAMSLRLLDGKVVVVTGGARGIGAAICRVLAGQGAIVGVNYAENRGAAEHVVQEIIAAGGQAIAYQADVRDTEAVRRMMDFVFSEYGRLDGVVNNAINSRRPKDSEEALLEDCVDAFDLGCRAVVNTLSAARPHFRQQGGGRMINIVAELDNTVSASWTFYMAGKGAMVGLSKSLAAELSPENITLNMVAPGWVADEKHDTENRRPIKPGQLRRHVSGDEIGNTCALLLSDLAACVTGSYLVVSGGRSPLPDM